MATYKEIHGVKVQYRDSDATAIEGDVWYNSSFGLLKMYAALGAWASGGNINTARHMKYGTGTQTAGILYGGNKNPNTMTDETETYDGSSWTELADLNSSRKFGGSAGTQTAALCIGGQAPGVDNSPLVESWNGASWTEVGDINTARRQQGVTGATNTAALCVSGVPASPLVEEFNGTSWTEIADVNTGVNRMSGGVVGTTAAALKVGGGIDPGANPGNVESWNGTSWTELADTNTDRQSAAMSGSNTASAHTFSSSQTTSSPKISIVAGSVPNTAITCSSSNSSLKTLVLIWPLLRSKNLFVFNSILIFIII